MANYGLKELYEVTIKATRDCTICGHSYEEDEVILSFDRVNSSLLSESNSHVAARGGYGNQTRVYWDDPRAMRMQIEKGISNPKEIAFLNNSPLFEYEEFSVPIHEDINAIEDSANGYTLKEIVDIDKPYFLYSFDTGDKVKVTDYTINGDKLKRENGYSNLTFDYYSKKKIKNLRVGQNQMGGFFKLEGKTRLKDDSTGQEKTGIIIIPKIRIMSDLSLRLGDTAQPILFGFVIEGQPVGPKGEQYVCEIYFLDEDLDADI